MRQDFYEEYTRIEREHWWFIARRRIILTTLNRFMSANTESYILDIGIGSGVMLRSLESFGNVLGCDREWVSLLSSLPEVCGRVVQAEAEHLPFESGSFNLVTLFDLLEHTVHDEYVLSGIKRVLKPGGLLCATVPMHRWLWGNQDLISRHVRRYDPGELERKIQSSGLDILYNTYFNSFLFPIVAMIRLFRRYCGMRNAECGMRNAENTAVSDFSITKPGRLNDLLTWIFSQEACWLRHRRLPIGVSLLCLARKPI